MKTIFKNIYYIIHDIILLGYVLVGLLFGWILTMRFYVKFQLSYVFYVLYKYYNGQNITNLNIILFSIGMYVILQHTTNFIKTTKVCYNEVVEENEKKETK